MNRCDSIVRRGDNVAFSLADCTMSLSLARSLAPAGQGAPLLRMEMTRPCPFVFRTTSVFAILALTKRLDENYTKMGRRLAATAN